MARQSLGKVDTSRFSMVPRMDVPRSAFDVVHSHKTTFDAGQLVPIYVDEVLPGDSFKLRMTAFCRLSTPLVPMMDNLEFESFFFYVPNRLLWQNWERFMGEQTAPGDNSVFLAPYVELDPNQAGVFGPGTLADYMGLTNNGALNIIRVSALPFRAYNMIWNDWFRDQDLQNPVSQSTGDGPDTFATGYGLLPRNKRADYFTTARPWPQKPMNIQQLPATQAYNTQGLNSGFPSFNKGFYAAEGIGAPVTGIGYAPGTVPSATVGTQIFMTGGRTHTGDSTYQTTGLRVRAGDGTAPEIRVLINDIRTANMVQVMLEKNSRGGTRYSEIVRSHFGVMSPDARLQRAEYLGGGRSMIHVNPVAQTSASGATGTTTKLGELAAIGTAGIQNHGFSASFTEHGIILGLVNVRSFLTYQQGNERMWNRRTQFDFYWPGLAHLGEQAILSQEIYADGTANDVTVFGYQERWSEYKYKPSRTSGFFRSIAATPLDMWHLGQKFTSRPVLNGAFVVDDPPVARVLQTATNFGEQFLFDSLFEVRKVRPMPMYSIPGMSGRL